MNIIYAPSSGLFSISHQPTWYTLSLSLDIHDGLCMYWGSRHNPTIKMFCNKGNIERSNRPRVDQSIPPITIAYAHMSYICLWVAYFFDYVEYHWHELFKLLWGAHQLESSVLSGYHSWSSSLLERIFEFQTDMVYLFSYKYTNRLSCWVYDIF